MTPERWQQIENLLDQALDLTPMERSALLDQACINDADLRREVEALLTAEADAPTFLDEGAAAFAAPAMGPGPASSVAGQQMGPYRLIRELGRGGMGVVYLAEREDVGKQVALKIVRGGSLDPVDTRRFLLERRVLARLEHPHIARLYDAGMADPFPGQPGMNTPYFAMEYVEGQPIDAYCDAKHLGIEDRLRLFETVGRAVQHAHQHFVIHRDLKPSNILVTDDGRVKLLDFGIAKVLAEAEEEVEDILTGTGRQVLTPAYAAPEQVQGETITAATDVYALGVILYELLTGRRPYDVSGKGLEAIQAVLTQDPKRPSTVVTSSQGTAALAQARNTTTERLSRRLRGDLDMVCLKALQKDPARRYASAEAFVEDIRRHLAGLPVVAQPDTPSYRLKKFVRRHRVGATMAVAFGVLVLGFALAMAVQQQQTARERDRAQVEAEKAHEVTDFLLELFEANEPETTPTDTITARTLLARSLERAHEMDNQPEVQAEMLGVIGKAYRTLGRLDEAEPLVREALMLQQTHLGNKHEATAKGLSLLGRVLEDKGAFREADSLYREALGVRRTLFGEHHADVASSLNDLGGVQQSMGNLTVADSLLRAALAIARAVLGDEHRQTIDMMNNLTNIQGDLGNFAAAESLQRNVLALRRRVLGEHHISIAGDFTNIGYLLTRQGKFEEADSFYRASLTLQRELLGDVHPRVASTLGNLGTLKGRAGDYEAAEPLLRESLALWQRIHGDRHPSVATAMNNLATLMSVKGDYTASAALHRQVLTLRRDLLGREHPYVAASLSSLAAVLSRMDRYIQAESLYREALAIQRKTYGKEHPDIAMVLYNLASLLQERRDYEQAEAFFRQALAMDQKLLGEEHFNVGLDRMKLAAVLSDKGDYEAAEGEFTEALDLLRRVLPEGHPRIAEALDGYGVLLTRKGTYDEAEQVLEEALSLRRARLGEDHPDTQETLENLVTLYKAWPRSDKVAQYRALLSRTK